MNAEILAVGTELLMGQIANTNAQYISRRLSEIGINVYHHSVVGDNPGRLKQSLDIAMKRSDIVVMTGGLGPTKDDLTKETVSEAVNRKLVLHEESLEKMKAFFERFNRTMAKNNVKQAYLPEGSIIVKNKNGTAPGCIIENEKNIIVMLPGPPSEMKPMFEETVIPFLVQKTDFRLESKYVRIFGIGESAMEERIIDLIEKQSNPTIAPYAKEGEVTLRITARYGKEENDIDLITPIIDEIKFRLGDTVYTEDGRNIEEVVADLLINNNITISIAESCTGGLISSKLTGISGISKVFNRGIITYSNQSKVESIGVKSETLDQYGAVSRETAVEMAKGVRNISNTDIGLSVTGIAGPGGGTDIKPVGLVYIALADKEKVECKELKLWGDRNRIRNVASLHAFDLIRRYILKLDI